MNENGLNYIDLFAGAGGLSEGFIQSGYRPVAHVEMNEHAAKTIETRIAYYYLKDNGKIKSYYDYEKGKITREQLLEKIPKEELKTVINKEMSEATIKGIFNTIDDIKREKEIDKIDVIIGGPPCQAYSLVGRAQSSHMIVPMEDDPRNELYIQFSERKEMTIDFELSPMEIELYVMINNYLKKEILYALPNSHRTLITSVIRKLLASSSMAVAETFKVLKGRLETLKETTRTESADKSIDFFLSFFDDDEIETDDDSKQDELYTREKVNEFIQHEIDEVTAIINKAESIKRNAKMTALKLGVETAFAFQDEAGIKQRIVVFTESIRTQQYMFEELSHAGYEGQILKFNGSTNDPVTKQIYKAWKARNYGKYVGSRNVELKNAIVEAFRDAVFEIIDITGKIYGVSDELARELCEKLQEQCLEEETPNNQEILLYIDKVDEFMQQKYTESKRIVLIANQKKLDNWLQSRKEEYLLTVKDTSDIDELKEKYAIEGDFRQKIALKKQIEILEKQKQKMIEAFHDEMSALEEEAVNMQKQFAENILVKTQLVIKIVIKF